MKCGIYKIENTKNGKFYIGSSSKIEKRWKTHKYSLANNTHHNIYLQRSFNKYGADSFIFEILEECSQDKLFELEERYINDLRPHYNLGSIGGGDNTSKHPENQEIRRKISKASKENYSKLTDDQKKEISLSLTGDKNPNWRGGIATIRPKCITCNKEISNYHQKCVTCSKIGESNPFYGKVHSEETRKKISEKNTGRENLKSRRRISIDGKVYPSMTQAAKELNVCIGTIYFRLRKLDTYIYLD